MNSDPPSIAEPYSLFVPSSPLKKRKIGRVISYILCGVLSLALGTWLSGQMRSSPELESWPLGWLLVAICGYVAYLALLGAWRILKSPQS